MEKNGVTFEILVYGKPVKEHLHEGRIFAEGHRGSEFTLRVRNTYQRVLAVVTVDGLSVMDAKVGSFRSGGYVIEPFGSVDIPGWRLNNEQVARFFFVKKGEAYAVLMDKPTNVGVIGCAVFREKMTIPHFASRLTLGGNTDNLDMRSEVNAKGNIGTGFGERAEHRVTEVRFEREPYPFATFEIHYDDRQGLVARGVNLKERPQVVVPDPFPGEPNHGCPPPPGWRG